jgi:hypothetical protein
VNSWDFSTMANLPLDSCAAPVKVPVTGFALGGSSERQCLFRRQFPTGTGNLAFLKRGDQVAPVGDATIGLRCEGRVSESVTRPVFGSFSALSPSFPFPLVEPRDRHAG